MNNAAICVVPEYPLNLMEGGVQVQALATFNALRERGTNVRMFEWSSSTTPADLYHFVGFPPYLASLANLLRRKGRPYVCTLLCGGQRDFLQLWTSRIRHRLNATLPGRREYHRAVVGANAIVTITQADAAVARFVFGAQASRITVVGNGVDARFRAGSPHLWRERYGDRPFVLCVGQVQPRKNQLFLLQVGNLLKLPVVLVGPPLSDRDDYAQRVAREARINTEHGGLWLRDVSGNDPLLASAYAACRVYVLLSHRETQPLSVLEAMAAGKPVLLGYADYAREYPFATLPRTSPVSVKAAVRDLDAVWMRGAVTTLPPEFAWDQVADRLSTIYERVLAESSVVQSGTTP